jgi:hypothetical protein
MSDPHKPAEYDEATIMAVRAFSDGKANDGQQKTVWNWLLHAVCQVEGMSYRAGGIEAQRATDFAEGRRYVGNQLRKMLNPIVLDAERQSKAKKTAPAGRGNRNEAQ